MKIDDGEYNWPWLKENKARGQILFNVLKGHLKPDDTILDVNCGYSPLASHLQSYQLEGFDNHIRPIMEMTKRYRNNKWHLMSYEDAWIPCSVMLLLGISDYPGFAEYIDRAVKFCYPRIIMIESSMGESYVEEFYFEILKYLNKRYNMVSQTLHYDAGKQHHSDRMFNIFELVPHGNYLTYYHEFNSPGYDPDWYNQGIYRNRNEVIVKEVKALKPNTIYEFACSFGYLASMILEDQDTIQTYTCNNILSEVLDIAEEQVSHENFKTFKTDANWTVPVLEFDLYICTAFEHLKEDRFIIKSMMSGSHFIFSVPNFRHYTHFRTFQNEDEIRDRYKDLLDIKSVTQIDTHNYKKKFVVVGEVK